MNTDDIWMAWCIRQSAPAAVVCLGPCQGCGGAHASMMLKRALDEIDGSQIAWRAGMLAGYAA